MRVVGLYPFNNGLEVMEEEHPQELREVYTIIEGVDCQSLRTKRGKEKTNKGRMLYSPRGLNKSLKKGFSAHGWKSLRVSCKYPTAYYVGEYTPETVVGRGAFREMDFVKNRVGIEVQFGKYSFMVYNVAAKMTIFSNLGHIDAGVEIVPVQEMASEMSTGVSYFEQFIWDLEHRGTADIDIPVLVIGIAPSL